MVVKMSVVYFSQTGNTEQMAQAIVKGANKIEGVECKAFSIENIDDDFVKESKCMIFGTPVYMATMDRQAREWLETQSLKYNTLGKLGGAFATADYAYGGGENATQNILNLMMVLGMMTYSGGLFLGKPYVHIAPVAIAGKLDEYKDVFEVYGQRLADKSKELFS